MDRMLTMLAAIGFAGFLQAQTLTCADAVVTELRGKDPQALSGGISELLGLVRSTAFPRGFGDEQPQPEPLLALEILQLVQTDGLRPHEKSEVYDHFSSIFYSLGEYEAAAVYAQKVVDEADSNPDALSNGLHLLGRHLLDSGDYCASAEYYFAYSCGRGGLSADEFAEVGQLLQGLGAAEGDFNLPKRVAQCRES